MRAKLDRIFTDRGVKILAGVPEGYDATLLAELAMRAGKPLLHLARDDQHLEILRQALPFFAEDIEILHFPAWDCLPYDRVSPKPHILATRMKCLTGLASGRRDMPFIVLSTINAALQRVPARRVARSARLRAVSGQDLNPQELIRYLSENGYHRSGQVMEPGDFAVRGGLIDLFPPSEDNPVRLDFFGDRLESLRIFDALSQRTTATLEELNLTAAGEFQLNPETIARFREGYHAHFGAVLDDDPLYHAISEGRPHHGAEHWLPLFHEKLETIFDYLPEALLTMDHQVDDAVKARLAFIADYYDARREALAKPSAFSHPYKPLPPAELYLEKSEWRQKLEALRPHRFSPFDEAESQSTLSFQAKRGRDFGPERREKGSNVYDALKDQVGKLAGEDRPLILASYSRGARDRLAMVLADHGFEGLVPVSSFAEVMVSDAADISLAILPIEHGFEAPDFALISESDLLGDRLVRKSRRTRRAENFLTESTSLAIGDLVVHVDHGVGRFEGLQTLDVGGASHDCLKLTYANGDRLYLPVENIEVLTRYGAEASDAALDRLGGVQWQKRHARLKKRLRDMADQLIKVAAARALKPALSLTRPDGLYEEFCARFPYAETNDQARAIEDVIDDLAAGKPMDRLVCGDVGFGKTEVALRAAFIAVMGGQQVAIVAPTTLLVRQHYETFCERFRGLPVNIGRLSRLVPLSEANETKEGLTSGQLDIIIGTHALLSKSVKIKTLGLIIIDEEQHFGVSHKERLKELKASVHVLTLTATPIPRTLQMALSGMRDLSLIATPPIDRLAIRTFVMPFDEIVIKEALMREHFRGGQSFFVCPRIADLAEAKRFIDEKLPELNSITAHGRMPPREIDDVMHAFYDGKYEVLISTSIIESGLHIPSVNSMIIYRADRFGLAQLYQLRGRIGRAKIRAYAYLTIPPARSITGTAEKRLQVLQSLDTLGAGFTVASHDMDIRGAGNLLGEEQSGHIREVGMELYQQMLEAAVAEARSGSGREADRGLEGETGTEAVREDWSPSINLGVSVLIPEGYVGDLNTRMALYRRLGRLDNRDQVEAFAAELIDRFGPLPEDVEHLLVITHIKANCRQAGIEKLEAGGKGITIQFRNNHFNNPAGLVAFISASNVRARLRPDHSLVLYEKTDRTVRRLDLARQISEELAGIAGEGSG